MALNVVLIKEPRLLWHAFYFRGSISMQKHFVFKTFSIIFLVLLYCSRAPLNATTLSTESTFNDSLEKTETHTLLESNTFTNLIEIDHIAINGDAELLQMAKDNDWPGTGDKSDPIIIEGYYFRYNGNMFIVDGTELYWEFSNNVLFGTDDRWCAIVISDLKNCKISDNYFTRGSVGIHSIRVHDCQFINNVFDFQSWDGVFLEDSYNNIILENTFIKGGEGGVFGWAGSIDNTILYNEVYGSPYGFLLWGDADGNTIQHNSIHDISYRGLDIQASNNIIQENDIHDVDGDAIYVSGFETEIKNNRIYNNLGYGIKFSSGSGSATIENNVVICNQAGGINLHLSNYNHIENNDFYNNSWCQAWDSGNNNIFTDNYWHEW
ncbi:MAG: right-handed parallel beta-helix repeat-containing protein, partial [Candidatus Thorarchaeota archaeon]